MNIKVKNMFRIISRIIINLYVKNVSKEKSDQKDSDGSHWESELRVVKINRKTGEIIIE